jgi:signal recognition particle receptor subunit beta
MMEHKIVFTGVAGAGKTTAISRVSDAPPMNADVRNHDPSLAKEFTTVGMDYGEVALDNGDRLRLYGTPGQERFEFMWRVIGRGALGVVFLCDNSQREPVESLMRYVDSFHSLVAETACVVGVGRSESHPSPAVDDYVDALSARNVICPVVPVDVREKDDVLLLLDLLLAQLETKE